MNDQNSNPSLTAFFEGCKKLSAYIEQHQDSLITLLRRYETDDAAHDEITRSIEALRGVSAEMAMINDPLQGLNIATIFPLNLPLYSLVIFGVIPSAFAKNVFIRPPEVMQPVLAELWDVLDIHEQFPMISLKPTPREAFVQLYASECDVIIFTGKYENALAIHKRCPYALLVYNGSGVNPLVLFDNADVDLAAAKAVEMRCFNSGQDCAGPDAFFVPRALKDQFVGKLEEYLKDITVGDTKDPSVRIGPTMKASYIAELKEWLEHRKDNIVYGGKIDDEHHLVYPTIIVETVKPSTDYEFHEFFAPYFYVMVYDDLADLEQVLDSESFKERGMYVSVFGDNQKIEASLTSSVQVLKNVIVNDVEQGNEQYGGFGVRANFLLFGDKKIVHPVLISRDMHAVLSR
jgi:acyl-CoA reductase-like NAD-dependent aldehyde dehydrogenase